MGFTALYIVTSQHGVHCIIYCYSVTPQHEVHCIIHCYIVTSQHGVHCNTHALQLYSKKLQQPELDQTTIELCNKTYFAMLLHAFTQWDWILNNKLGFSTYNQLQNIWNIHFMWRNISKHLSVVKKWVLAQCIQFQCCVRVKRAMSKCSGFMFGSQPTAAGSPLSAMSPTTLV